MEIPDDILKAKQVLSPRLLRAGLRGVAEGASFRRNVREAIAFAGQTVHGVGIGYKMVEGKATDQLCLRIYVVQKLPPSLLPPRDFLPKDVDGIPTDIIEEPFVRFMASRSGKKGGGASKLRKLRARSAATAAALADPPSPGACTTDRKKRQRPIIAGTSTAHFQVTNGTIGAFCRSTRLGDDPTKVYVLSNNHVLANVNHAHDRDDLLQPGPADGGTSADHFAELARFVKIDIDETINNTVDAAIGELLPGIEFRPEICGIGPLNGVGQAVLDMEVKKHGRNTGLTEGTVDGLNCDRLVSLDHHNPPTVLAHFINQIRLIAKPSFPAFALDGDSGSLVVDAATNRAIGLFFAGTESGLFGYANPIENVLTELQIELLS